MGTSGRSGDEGAALRDFALLTGFALTGFVFLSFALTWASLALGATVSWWHFPLALAGTAGLIYWYVRSGAYASAVVRWSALASIGALIASLAVASFFFDTSYDGQAYHQEAVIQLADGWNPVTEELDEATPHSLWIRHYPKGPWIEAAVIYEATNRIESGKAVNLLLIAASFCFSLALLRTIGCSVVASVPLSLLAAFNPVSLYQSLSFYVDGQLASLLLSLSAALALAFLLPRGIAAAGVVMLVVLIVNVKFTGFVYGALLVFAFLLALLARSGPTAAVRKGGYAVAALTAAVLVIGFNPYVKNTLSNGNPFYPLMGEGAVDASIFRVDSLRPFNRVEALAASMLSESSDVRETFRLKVPFHVRRAEIAAFDTHDIRIGGWGPWFSGLVLASVACFGLYAPAGLSRAPAAVKWTLLAAGCLLVTALVNREAWWARYTPQLFFIPLILALPLCLAKVRWAKAAAGSLLLIGGVNALMVAFPYLSGHYSATRRIERVLREVGEDGKPVSVYFGPFHSNRIRLTEAGIAYHRVVNAEDLDCEEARALPGSGGRVRICGS